ncbi:predicted protein [Sclerotinia sclerotiorum 1980 UF-70]|uniref:Uncharacterized protein n=1 Tax=Sclerotinia sclerotiorum (strain ATCC 18683 / 1980 / Ss-1) TaxID=665079 RepID=A7EWN7_SCLS1|nr:predicted protein [Sclerotinia sclerotiorum 1980 UF-70]EDN93879.1 predicted protein [Sclerotinia sclerotiorum 1980 UF-70]
MGIDARPSKSARFVFLFKIITPAGHEPSIEFFLSVSAIGQWPADGKDSPHALSIKRVMNIR